MVSSMKKLLCNEGWEDDGGANEWNGLLCMFQGSWQTFIALQIQP